MDPMTPVHETFTTDLELLSKFAGQLPDTIDIQIRRYTGGFHYQVSRYSDKNYYERQSHDDESSPLQARW